MADLDLSESVTAFRGFDEEKLSIHREVLFTGRLDEAVRRVMQLSSDERYSAIIRIDKDHRILKIDEIKDLHAQLIG